MTLAAPDNEQAANILNIQYSIFLSIILSFSFYVDTSVTPTVCTIIDIGKRPEALLFAVYFVLDWFTANVVQQRRVTAHACLLTRVAWVAVLGATVISLNGSGLWKFVLLSFYVFVSGLYDFWLMISLFHDKANPESVIGLLFAGSRFIVGATFLIPTAMATIGRLDVLKLWDDPNSASDILFYMSLIYVLLKGGRFAYLAGIEVPAHE